MRTDAIPEVARRVLNLFFVIDTSGSMAGEAIGQVNVGISDTIETLKQEAVTADAQLKISVLEFNSGATWLNSAGPQDIEDFAFTTPLQAGGLTDMGKALKELNSKLSRKEYLNSIAGNYLPVIIFLSDGYPTDDYKKALEDIRLNKWFNRATKIAIGVGDDPDYTMLANVTGNIEHVIKISDLSLLARIITFASVTSSMVQSQSTVTGAENDIGSLIDTITDEIGGEAITASDIDTDQYIPEAVDTDPADPNDPWNVGWN